VLFVPKIRTICPSWARLSSRSSVNLDPSQLPAPLYRTLFRPKGHDLRVTQYRESAHISSSTDSLAYFPLALPRKVSPVSAEDFAHIRDVGLEKHGVTCFVYGVDVELVEDVSRFRYGCRRTEVGWGATAAALDLSILLDEVVWLVVGVDSERLVHR